MEYPVGLEFVEWFDRGMSEKQSDQTEKPTPKRLQDARKDGNVSKSQDLSKTLTLLIWLGLLGMMTPKVVQTWMANTATLWQIIPQTSGASLVAGLFAAGKALLAMVLPPIWLAAVAGVFLEFLQVGPVLSLKPVKPDLKKVNPADGLKRMFSQRNLIELVKSVAKTLIVTCIILLVLKSFLEDLFKLPGSSVHAVFEVYWQALRLILVSVVVIFIFVSVLDVAYQKFAYTKDLMMSIRDIKQEHKNSEGDPLLKSKRRQLHQEWSQENSLASVRRANVVVTNPTHYAVAIYYLKGETDLPMVTAKGEDYMAGLIKDAAREAGVPMMENVELARGLYRDVEVESYITNEFFEAVAQVLHWAESAKKDLTAE